MRDKKIHKLLCVKKNIEIIKAFTARPWQAQSGGESFAARVLTVAAVNDIINIYIFVLSKNI